MKRFLTTTALSALLIVPAALGAQTLEKDRTPQDGMDGEQASESLLGDSPDVDPQDVPDGAATLPVEGPQEGAEDVKTSDAPLEAPDVLPDQDTTADETVVDDVTGPQAGAESGVPEQLKN